MTGSMAWSEFGDAGPVDLRRLGLKMFLPHDTWC